MRKYPAVEKENLIALIDILTKNGARLEINTASMADITGRSSVTGLTNKYDVFIIGGDE